MLFAPLLHQALIVLGDGEPVLLLAVAGTIGVGEEGLRHPGEKAKRGRWRVEKKKRLALVRGEQEARGNFHGESAHALALVCAS
jgi:hypothetical protein